MRRLLALSGLVGLVLATMVFVAGPAGAADAKGCSGSGTSFDADNKQLDTASAPGPGGTKEHPFEVDPDGHVQYEYDIQGEIASGKWSVKLLGPISFGDDIADDEPSTGGGDEPMESYLKPGGISTFVGLIKTDIEIKNQGGATVCTFSGYIKIGGSLLESPIFYLSIVFILLAILLGFWGMGEPI